MSTKANVTAAAPKVAGCVYIADTTASMPENATSELGTGWTSLGYIGESGLVNSSNLNTNTVKAFGGDEVLVIYNGREDTFEFTLLEALNVDVLKAVFGSGNVDGTLATGISIDITSDAIPSKAFCFELVMRDGAVKRIVIPDASVTSVGNVTYGTSDAVGYDVTIKALPDSTGSYHKEYISKATS